MIILPRQARTDIGKIQQEGCVCLFTGGDATKGTMTVMWDGPRPFEPLPPRHAGNGRYLRAILVYKPPKDLNQDWSPRFSTLRHKNGWIRPKTA